MYIFRLRQNVRFGVCSFIVYNWQEISAEKIYGVVARDNKNTIGQTESGCQLSTGQPQYFDIQE